MIIFLTVLITLAGIILAGGGIWLIALGGSWYYLLCAIGFLVTAAALWRRHPAALYAYAVVVLGSLIWAVYEVGFDWWALAPRGGFIAIIGLLLLVLWFSASEARLGARWPQWRMGGYALLASLAVSVAVAAYAMATDSHSINGQVQASSDAMLPPSEAAVPPGEWLGYGRTRGGSHYSPLGEITPQNVNQLTKVWQYHTGDVRNGDDTGETTYEVTPTMVDGRLYLCTPHDVAIALDPDSGEELWRYDANVGRSKLRQHQTCRGLTYYRTDEAASDAPCVARILLPTADARLLALDAATGEPCPDFGENGAVNLWANMPNVTDGAYYSTSPPVAANGLIVIGGAVNDNVSTTEPSGVIRAYDWTTGELVWNFDSGNPDETKPLPDGETYVGNSPNAWSMLSVDADLGMVYAPMGNAPPDQFGGNRTKETERFSSSITALDLKTGQVKWVFQAVHHDLWDMDTPSQPQLVDIPAQGDSEAVPALVQATKQGDIYVLDRRTGEPIAPVTEEPAPQGAVEGDKAATEQPTSAMSFKPAPLRESDMWGATMFDQLYCRIRFHELDYQGRYTPPSLNGSIIYPGNFGTFNWGGVAIDPLRQMVFANPVYLAFIVKLVPRADDATNYVSDGVPGFNENYGAPYAAAISPFYSPIGLPCQQPPWGYVAGADLRTGKVIWQHKNGTVRDLSPLPLPFKMGVPGIGGPIVTAGGVAFYSGSMDYYARAYDTATGKELWRDRLPAGGQATPMTYEGQSGRQYVVVVAGGHGSTGTEKGDSIIAYALPE